MKNLSPENSAIQNSPINATQETESTVAALDQVLEYVKKSAESAEIRLKEIKDDAKEQKNYLLLGFFILGVMVATMVIMIGGMVYSTYNTQAQTEGELNENIIILLSKMKPQ